MGTSMFALLATLVALTAGPARAECLTRSRDADLRARLVAAERAYESLDDEGFFRNIEESRLLLPCLSEVISPETAAQIHRLEALRHFVQGEARQTTDALRAARAVAPTYVWDDALLPPDHAIRREYDALGDAPGPTTGLRRGRGNVAVDGATTWRLPTTRPTVLQRLGTDGAVGSTTYQPPGQVPPDLSPRKNQTILLVGGGAALGLAATSFGAAWASRAALNNATWAEDPDPSTPENEAAGDNDRRFKDLQGQTNALTAASAGFLGVAGGLVTVAFVVRN